MKINEEVLKAFNQLAKDQNFVFDEKDLKILFNQDLNLEFYRTYKKFFELGLLKRFCRGIYVSEGFDLLEVNRKLEPESYLSFEYVLAKHSLIGTYSPYKVRSVTKQKKSRTFVFQNYSLEQFKVCNDSFFGFSIIDGYRTATPEKAYLDCLYFYTKGLKYSFDLFSDLDIQLLDQSLVHQYLIHYRNPKFISFVKGLLK